MYTGPRTLWPLFLVPFDEHHVFKTLLEQHILPVLLILVLTHEFLTSLVSRGNADYLAAV